MEKILKYKKSILKIIIFLFMLYLFIYLGTKDYHLEVSDNERFASEYRDIPRNNLFRYTKGYEILDILNGKSGILFFGFPNNIWSHYYADYLNEIALLNSVPEIYYYNFKKDRSLNNSTYNSIVKKLKNYLIVDDSGNMDLFAPTVVIVKNGNVIYFENEMQVQKGELNPEEYFTNQKKNLLEANFDLAIKGYLKEEA